MTNPTISPNDDLVRSWQPRICVGGKWRANGYRFHSREAALEFATTVASRMAFKGESVTGSDAVASTDAPNQGDDE